MINSYTNKLIIVDKPFLKKLEYLSETEYQKFINPGIDTQVITLPLQADQIRDLVTYIDPSDIKAGTILVKPSYSTNFATIDKFSEDIVLQKFGLFVRLCIALGAKEVSVNSVEGIEIKNNNDNEIKSEADFKAPVITGKASFNLNNSSDIEDIKNSVMSLNAKAQGGEPNLEEASRIMTEYGLTKDSLFSNIYNMRRTSTNPLISHDLVLDFSNDFQRAFDSSLSASVSAMYMVYKGSASFELAKTSLEKIKSATKLKVTVVF